MLKEQLLGKLSVYYSSSSPRTEMRAAPPRSIGQRNKGAHLRPPSAHPCPTATAADQARVATLLQGTHATSSLIPLTNIRNAAKTGRQDSQADRQGRRIFGFSLSPFPLPPSLSLPVISLGDFTVTLKVGESQQLSLFAVRVQQGKVSCCCRTALNQQEPRKAHQRPKLRATK